MLDLLIRYLGLMVSIAMVLGSIERLHLGSARKKFLIGLAFGVAASLLMLSPVTLSDGTVINGRSIFLGFAAAFGGLPAFATATAVTTVMLWWLANADLSQAMIATGLAGAWGFSWKRFLFPVYGFRIWNLILLGTGLASLALLLLFSSSGDGLSLFMHTLPAAAIGALSGALILGRLIEREFRHLGNERRWREEAYTDSLTTVANKRAFFEATDRLEHSAQPYAIAVIDIDHFKRVNDTCGHASGDEVLRQVANKITQTLPRDAEVFRLGGEEFVVIFVAGAAESAASICETVRSAIESSIRVDRLTITVSIGVATGVATIGSASIIGAADAALYVAKGNGRNQVVSSDTGLTELSSTMKISHREKYEIASSIR